MGGYMIIKVVRLDFFGTVPITTNFLEQFQLLLNQK